jgi:hypothetical protein
MEPVVFKVTVSSGNFGLPPQLGLEPPIHTSEALTEWYLNSSQRRQLIIQTVQILQLDSAVTYSLPRRRVVRPFQPYFPIT